MLTLKKISIALNLAIAAVTLFAWLKMALRIDENGVLSAPGLHSLKYFTVLSNLLQGVASLIYAVALLTGGAPLAVRVLKYAATTSVALTFATVVCFLGPVFGFKGMYEGANLWFHLLTPVLAALDFVLLDRSGPIPFAASFVAIVPMALYAAFYVTNLLVNGVGEGRHTNDWYGFMRGGWSGAAVIAAVIALGTWAMALLMRLPRRGA